ncbi:MAG TPA: trypsin-like peptidase domain-containing protein [Gaiellaceae bacterium]|nr:trypsin-like peptidase domain-containing protein [Gaiellaceae bacterium]
MARSRILSVRAAELAAVALVGGAAALGGAALLGKLGSHTTIQQVSPVGGSTGVANASLQAPAKGVTPETIYHRDAPGVVQITSTSTSTQTTDPFGFPATPQTQQSLGSGFVIDKAGHIVTNYHVISGATRVQVSFSSRDELDAKVVGSDPSTDIAVLKIDTHSRALTPLPLGDSDSVRVGDQVYAIGNPFGYTRTLTSGVVSALQRQIVAPNSLQIDGVIQTDAAINHGNSGGPLIDAAGRVIGVTSQISTGTTGEQGNIGIGFAIPINTVRNVAAQIIKSGKVEHAVLGIRVVAITPQIAKLFNLPTKSGVMVDSVDKGGGADKAGIKGRSTDVVVQGETYPLGGDIIVSVDHVPVTTPEQLREAIARNKPGEKVGLELYRHGQKKTVTVKLGNAPEAVR